MPRRNRFNRLDNENELEDLETSIAFDGPALTSVRKTRLPKTFAFDDEGTQCTATLRNDPKHINRFNLTLEPSTGNPRDDMAKVFKGMGITLREDQPEVGPKGELVYRLDAEQSKIFNEKMGITQARARDQEHEPQQEHNQERSSPLREARLKKNEARLEKVHAKNELKEAERHLKHGYTEHTPDGDVHHKSKKELVKDIKLDEKKLKKEEKAEKKASEYEAKQLEKFEKAKLKQLNLLGKIEALEEERDGISGFFADFRRNRCQKEINSLRKELRKADERVEHYQEKEARTFHEYEEKHQSADQRRKRIAHAREEKTELNNAVKTAKGHIKEAEEHLKESRTEVKELEKQRSVDFKHLKSSIKTGSFGALSEARSVVRPNVPHNAANRGELEVV